MDYKKLPCGEIGDLPLHALYLQSDLPAVEFPGLGNQQVNMDFDFGVVCESNGQSDQARPVVVYRDSTSKRELIDSPLGGGSTGYVGRGGSRHLAVADVNNP